MSKIGKLLLPALALFGGGRGALADPTFDITGVVSAMGAGAGKSRDGPWIGSFRLVAWRQGDGPIMLQELRIEKPLGPDDKAIDGWKDKPEPRSTVRLRITTPISQDTNPPIAQLVKYLGTASDPELETAADPILNPPDFVDPVLGRFKANDMLVDLFEKTHIWLGRDIALSLSATSEGDISQGVEIVKQLLEDQAGWQAKAENGIKQSLYELWIDVWQQDRPDLSQDAFAKKMQLQTISIENDGSFTFWFDDADLFWGHAVLVSGSIDQGFSGAEIAG